MMEPLAAMIGVSTILAGVIVVLGLTVQLLESAHHRPTSERRHPSRPERRGSMGEEPRSAQIPPFVRKLAFRPQPVRPLLVSTWRRRRNRNAKRALELCWAFTLRPLDQSQSNRRGGLRRSMA